MTARAIKLVFFLFAGKAVDCYFVAGGSLTIGERVGGLEGMAETRQIRARARGISEGDSAADFEASRRRRWNTAEKS